MTQNWPKKIRCNFINQKRRIVVAGLPSQYERMEVAGFGPKQAKAAEKAGIETPKSSGRVAAVVTPKQSASQVASAEPRKMLESDVTAEYMKTATPGEGGVEIPDGIDVTRHKTEIRRADWLVEKFGGIVKLIKEADDIKTPDYIWHDKFWELKQVSSINSVDKMLQKALKQIIKNPGGVILDLDGNSIDEKAMMKQIAMRFGRSAVQEADIMITSDEELISILRMKK